jgi:3-phosphoinositide dependent protein kinase-1
MPDGQSDESSDASDKPPIPRRKLQLSDFTFGKTLGEGSFGRVVRAEDSAHRPYAVKILRKCECKSLESVKTERDSMILLSHSNIIRLYCTFQDRSSFYFVEDFVRNGTLCSAVEQHRIGPAAAKCLLAQLVSGISYMHDHRVVHRDLKPTNILLDFQNRVKICDFGSAKIYTANEDMKDQMRSSFVGSPGYMSPEMLEKKVCAASDIWAFGCILYFVLVGHAPFNAGTTYDTYENIKSGLYDLPESICDAGRDLICQLLTTDPTRRPTCEAIQRHSFFADVDWETVSTMRIELESVPSGQKQQPKIEGVVLKEDSKVQAVESERSMIDGNTHSTD